MKIKKNFLKNLYLVLFLAIFLIVVLDPYLVKKYNFFNEANVEFISLAFLVLFGLAVNHLYVKESKKLEKQFEDESKKKKEMIDENFRYIGQMNVRLQEFESALTAIKKYPETKKEMKVVLDLMANKILGIVNADWVVIRIVDTIKNQTLAELNLVKNNKNGKIINIPNKNLVDNTEINNMQIISATEKTFSLNTYCILPIKTDKDERMIIETIANQIDMLYIIFTSTYYQNRKKE